jgi:hypothetical protein
MPQPHEFHLKLMAFNLIRCLLTTNPKTRLLHASEQPASTKQVQLLTHREGQFPFSPGNPPEGKPPGGSPGNPSPNDSIAFVIIAFVIIAFCHRAAAAEMSAWWRVNNSCFSLSASPKPSNSFAIASPRL